MVTAVATLGGGGTSFDLMIAFGACAALAGLISGAVMLVVARRSARATGWLGPLIAWMVWALAAGASIPVIEPLWRSSRQIGLLFVPPLTVLLVSAIGVGVSIRATRTRRAS